MKNNIIILFLLVSLSSCNFFNSKKEEKKVDTSKEIKQDIGSPKTAIERTKYMNSLPMYDSTLLQNKINELPKNSFGNRSVAVWGIGPDHRVYKWGGVLWEEPNPQARLKWVDVSVYGGGVWGVGADRRVYIWNGVTWTEPNPNAALHYISAISGGLAVGLGSQGRLYITYDAGLNWSRFTSIEGIQWTSVGNSSTNFFWGVDANFNPIYYENTTNSWIHKTAPSQIQNIAATWADGAWAIKHHDGNLPNSIYRSIDGISFSEPNSQANLQMISAYDSSTAWGIGEKNRVFTTNNGGLNWSEPNPDARLIHVSIGND
jgi:hypothetical protein